MFTPGIWLSSLCEYHGNVGPTYLSPLGVFNYQSCLHSAICQLEFRFFHPSNGFHGNLWSQTSAPDSRDALQSTVCLSSIDSRHVSSVLLNLSQVCGLAYMCFLQDGILWCVAFWSGL